MNKNFTHILVIEEWYHGEYKGFNLRELWKRVGDSGKVYWDNKKHNSTESKWIPPTHGIRLRCQTGGFNGTDMYAFQCESNAEFDINHLDEAEAAIKRLKKISSKLDELQSKYGHAKTFTEFAAYIADAISAEFAEYDREMDTYRYVDVESLAYKERKLTGK